MSWDIVIFNSKQKINSIEEIEEALFEPIDFNAILVKQFANIIANENQREIKGNNYAICYFVYPEPVSNQMFSLYGEQALFELIKLSKMYNWQIFDTGNGEMLDLEHPERNGQNNFQRYLQQVLGKSD